MISTYDIVAIETSRDNMQMLELYLLQMYAVGMTEVKDEIVKSVVRTLGRMTIDILNNPDKYPITQKSELCWKWKNTKDSINYEQI